MLCGISGETPKDPVVSLKTGVVFERRLIEQYLRDNGGKEPNTNEDLSSADLLPLRTARVVPPRPPRHTSIPSLLGIFQTEWDALALETYRLREELGKTHEELATALYQNDAAVRVIARLTRERDEARQALANITVSAGGADAGAGDEMAIDSAVEALPVEVTARVDRTQKELSKTRKKRPTPESWVTADQLASFSQRASTPLGVPNASSIAVEGGYAAVAGLQGEAAIYSVDVDKLERQVPVGEPVTASAWSSSKLVFATAKGSVKVFDGGSEVASFADHSGPATAVSIHPSGDILASVGSDKAVVVYDLASLKRVGRCYADSALTVCAFHPDGHIFGVGTQSGDIKLYMTNTLEVAATFSLGAPVQALVFSENGFWFAATAKGQSSVTVFDLRKEGSAAVAKVLETGGAMSGLAWDYTGQFLATAGPTGVTVQQYAKSTKKWSEPLRIGTAATAVAWGADAQKLLGVNAEGVVAVFGAKTE